MPGSEPTQPFYLIVTDHDRGGFAVEGPMTDDRPWKEAAAYARNQHAASCAAQVSIARLQLNMLGCIGWPAFHPAHREASTRTDQLPAIVRPGALTTTTDTYIVPALIACAGDHTEFFTANIRNPHTRGAYARACARFFTRWEQHGPITDIRPFDVAAWVNELQETERSRAEAVL